MPDRLESSSISSNDHYAPIVTVYIVTMSTIISYGPDSHRHLRQYLRDPVGSFLRKYFRWLTTQTSNKLLFAYSY